MRRTSSRLHYLVWILAADFTECFFSPSSLLCTHIFFNSADRTAVGRTSIFSAAQTRTIVIILLADLLPGVKADCRIDSYAPW
ncbi:hypothetical protein EDB92DRAFT_188907 [Lactarius akahatsu]|uniref:Uncharacterized protein n=1 Tax=Lactarius akahatsu TaxID=416441 RepID=A0AAD4Q8R6_9AGAM|nr:hypothetical protein EDB92DRAFT_188907 [Lactarius akahatsu]